MIFDEITCGWRLDVGGAFKKFGVSPDIVVYGKAIANGYPMAVVVGKSEVMDIAQVSFISSTFWTERIGPTASIATINKMQTHNIQKHLCRIGEQIMDGWRKLALENELKLTTSGISPLGHFTLDHGEKSLALRTLFTQEMLKRGYLASNSVYVSYKHTNEIIESYLEDTNEVFAYLREALEKDTVIDLLEGPVAHSGFKRLT